jgi:hypothetical protein
MKEIVFVNTEDFTILVKSKGEEIQYVSVKIDGKDHYGVVNGDTISVRGVK